jgi:hypothetical protein
MAEIACPACQSDNIIVACLATVRCHVTGEFLGEQSWTAIDVLKGCPQEVLCGDCGRRLKFGIVGGLLSHLAAPEDPPSRFSHEENSEVAQCVLLLESTEGAEAVACGDRLLIRQGICAVSETPTYIYEGEKPVSCLLAAYEDFRARRPGLNLPKPEEHHADDDAGTR